MKSCQKLRDSTTNCIVTMMNTWIIYLTVINTFYRENINVLNDNMSKSLEGEITPKEALLPLKNMKNDKKISRFW